MEKLSRNFMWMAAANIAGASFSAVTGIYLARVLKAEALGYVSYVFTILFFLYNFIDLGLSTYGIREIAGNRNRFSEYVSEIASFRLCVAAVLSIGFVLAALFLPETALVKILMIEAALILLLLACSAEWAFQGLEKMHMVFVSFFVMGSLQLSLALVFVKGPEDVLKIPVLYMVSIAPIIVVFLKRLKFRFSISAESLKRMSFYLSSSLIIWGISVFAQIYNNLDVFMLGLFRPLEEVGYFTIARRVVGGISLLLIFLANATLPRLSCTFVAKDITAFKDAVGRFLKLGIALLVLILTPLVLFTKKIIVLTVGIHYLPASAPLAIMTAGLALILFNLPYSTALIAACLEKEVLKQAAASAGVSIFLNFALIPKYGMIGASVSFVAAEAVALLWILGVYNRKIRIIT